MITSVDYSILVRARISVSSRLIPLALLAALISLPISFTKAQEEETDTPAAEVETQKKSTPKTKMPKDMNTTKTGKNVSVVDLKQKAWKELLEANNLSEEDRYKDPPPSDPNLPAHPDAKVEIGTEDLPDGPPAKVEIIVDSSGSMGQTLAGSKTKMWYSKKLITRYLIDQWKEKAKVGMRVYGSRMKNDCDDNYLSVGFNEKSILDIEKKVAKMLPIGRTPIDASIREAIKDLMGYQGPKRIVLFTDGEETCKGDPCKLNKDLEKYPDVDIKIYVVAIGFNPDSTSFQKVACIGDASSANSEGSMADATGQISNSINTSNNLVVKSPDPLAQVSIYKWENGVRKFFRSFTAAWGTRVPPGEYEVEVNLDPIYKFPKVKIPPRRRVTLTVSGKGEIQVKFARGLMTAELLDGNSKTIHMFTSDKPFLAESGKYKLRLSAPPFFGKVVERFYVFPNGKHLYKAAEAGVIQFDYPSISGLYVYNLSDVMIGTYITNSPLILPVGTYRLFIHDKCFLKAAAVVPKTDIQHFDCETQEAQ